jgi:CheY-like chemotaxis protein
MVDHTVVIIDDSNVDLELLAQVVGELPGVTVVKFQSGLEAQQFLSVKQRPEVGLILCDYSMPEVNGLDLLQLIRESSMDTPFIFVSAHASLALAKSCKEFGANHFIIKPFISQHLLHNVGRFLAA